LAISGAKAGENLSGVQARTAIHALLDRVAEIFGFQGTGLAALAPFAQGVTDNLTEAAVFTSFDSRTHIGRDIRCNRDTQAFDIGHGNTVPRRKAGRKISCNEVGYGITR
jgi:hypothetical protein